MENVSFDELNSMRKKCNLMLLLAVLLGFISVPLIFLAIRPWMLPCGLVGAVFTIIIVIKRNKLNKTFKSIYKDQVVLKVLQNHFQDVRYDWKSGFNYRFVQDMGIIASGNTYHSEDYLTAVYKGVRFQQADVTIEEETTDSDGNTTTTVYFKGRIICIDYPKQTDFVRLISKKFRFPMHLRKKNYPDVEMENVAFNKNFAVKSSVPQDAFYLLTPQMMEKLTEIVNVYGNVGMTCFGNRLNIAINTKRNAFDVRMSKKLTYENEMALLTQDVQLIENLIDIIYA
ncbi:Protein of unknown function [Eubacterium ruminantium]|nr:Protein of unknown function [Eubacterium ruminantium]